MLDSSGLNIYDATDAQSSKLYSHLFTAEICKSRSGGNPSAFDCRLGSSAYIALQSVIVLMSEIDGVFRSMIPVYVMYAKTTHTQR